MPILASCPYCGKGKVRAPKDAIGLTATCPNCRNCFTIVESNQLAKAPAGPLPPAASAAVSNREQAETAVAPPIFSSAATTAPEAVQVSFPTSDECEREPRVLLGLALIALTLCGIGLAASQLFSYGRIVTAFFAIVGLFLALVSLILSERKALVPAAASFFNGATLLIVILLPGWLGLTTWKPVQPMVAADQVQSVGLDHSMPTNAEWVDVSQASWQLDDVRITATAISLAPVELTGPKEKKIWTKDRFLNVWLRIRNVGVTRRIDFQGWDLKPPPESPVIKLTDAAGKEIKLKSFDAEWTPSGLRQPAALYPGKQGEQLLIFEAPPADSGPLKLELPATPFAGTQPVRLLIPRSSILNRTTP